ncbi:MAG: type II secretion system protein M [Sphingomonadaceae bacterium]|nr:type II secretion system protein M [Sphingomonadaceae bacterium]
MTEGFREWWKTRTVREQRLVLAAASLAIVIFAWLLVVRPLGLWLDSAKARHDRAVIALAQVESQLAAIDAARAVSRSRPDGRVLDIVQAEAVRAGFNVTQTEAIGSDGVRVIIGSARPQAFFVWVSDLETRLGLDVEALTARPNSDETLSVDVTFRGG